MDLEAVEMALRAALQQAGAAGLSQLLRQQYPAESQVSCSCGDQARYQEMRTKPLLTVRGSRGNAAPLLLVLPLSARANSSADVALDVENTELSPGVRRMLALVGQ